MLTRILIFIALLMAVWLLIKKFRAAARQNNERVNDSNDKANETVLMLCHQCGVYFPIPLEKKQGLHKDSPPQKCPQCASK